MQDSKSERETQGRGESGEQGEEEGEVAGEKVAIEELPEPQNVEAARSEKVAERHVQLQPRGASHHPREQVASHSQSGERVTCDGIFQYLSSVEFSPQPRCQCPQ